MNDRASHEVIQRIERAVARIEKAATARAYAADAVSRRHTALRNRMEEAVAALDDLIARQDEQERAD